MAYTRLSLAGTPGRPYARFVMKGTFPRPPVDQFTELSVMALPGPRHSFTHKTWDDVQRRRGGGGGLVPGGSWDGEQWSPYIRELIDVSPFVDKLDLIRKDDDEILEILMQAILQDLI